MCEYCDGSKKPITTEVDGEAYITLTPDDSEYPEGFLLDVYKRQDDGFVNGWTTWTWMYSFIVPCCPMCGRDLRGRWTHERLQHQREQAVRRGATAHRVRGR